MASLFDTGKSSDQIVRETDKAVAIEWPIDPSRWGSANDAVRLVWLPKSQITWKNYSKCFAETIHIPGWLASAKSL
jgi:hypothetical protein